MLNKFSNSSFNSIGEDMLGDHVLILIERVLIFKQDNAGTYTSYLETSALENNDFTYSINKDKITIKFSTIRGEIESNYKLNENTLTIEEIVQNATFNRK